MSQLADLQPQKLFHHFLQITKIPHGSGNETALADHIKGLGERAGCEVVQDQTGNVVIRVPASPGHEQAPVIVLQGHIDMVCEKNADVDFDFEKDAIPVKREGDFLVAEGTTLGADNGIGVAAALAVMEDKDLVHGPLELLFTVDEERGLTGAKSLPGDILRGRKMINMDSEEDGAIYVGCAGGADQKLTLKVMGRSKTGPRVEVSVKGLQGGHSGLNIQDNRGNANQILARILLRAVRKGMDLRLISFDGGNKHNAIPREAWAQVCVPQGLDAFKEHIKEQAASYASLFAGRDEGLTVEIRDRDDKDGKEAMAEESQVAFLNMLSALPHGVLAMSSEIAGLVETSANLAIVHASAEGAEVLMSCRSSIAESLQGVVDGVASVAALSGAKFTDEGGYPGWKPNLNSTLLKAVSGVLERRLGRKPETKAIHAGLECGILGERFPGMEMISIGPDIFAPHSPAEKVKISTVQRFWEVLGETLKALA